ncbi:putative sodium-dependent multivitamin transporter [Argiope bruennichi]|uniref:putative sodium-dependent multivitamin transporter n=1 Tax=Argiope bruennichi TaxID=94029 RepID=UPI002494959F|nr:putative sodium-dependent multivitamin transporter [Argiope bruennichi]
MDPRANLGITDYLIIGFSLVISIAIGIKFQISDRGKSTQQEYLLAGKSMSIFPVVMSITVTILSAIIIIGHTGETFRYGIQIIVVCFGFPIGTVLASYIFLPVYFNCKVSTTYEYLDHRFGKTTRVAISALFLLQMMLYMSVVLYAPVIALSAVTNLSIEVSIFVFGAVCTFYCAVGGLRAVIWTDVFQASLMFLCLIVMYIKGVEEAGGVAHIYETSAKGGRLEIFDFKEDFIKRYTFLNAFCKGFFGSLAYYGTSQLEVQRMLSMKSVYKARAALNWSIIPVATLVIMCCFFGLVLYTVFNTCDPVADSARTGVTRHDQLAPYYIITRFNHLPGVTGICIAGIFSGSLSTISSALNSLSSVTVIDFIKPACKSSKLTEKKVVFIAKMLSVLYGAICIGLTFAVSKVDSIVSISNTFLSIMEGPILAVYFVAVLSRKGSEKNILIGLILGVTFTAWLGAGVLSVGYQSPTLPLDSSGCLSLQNSSTIYNNFTSLCARSDQCLSTMPSIDPEPSEPFFMYKISFMWVSTLGCFVTLFFIALAILLTGCRDVIPADSKYLSPVARFWIKGTSFETKQEDLSNNLKERNDLDIRHEVKSSHRQNTSV